MKSFVLFFCLFFCSTSDAAVELKSNVFFSMLQTNQTDFILRTYNTLYIGLDQNYLGIFVNYEPLHKGLTDISAGASYRFGADIFYEVGGGLFSRTYEQLKGTGIMAHAQVGVNLTSTVSISATLAYKSISSGELERRTIIDLLPFIGFGVVL